METEDTDRIDAVVLARLPLTPEAMDRSASPFEALFARGTE